MVLWYKYNWTGPMACQVVTASTFRSSSVLTAVAITLLVIGFRIKAPVPNCWASKTLSDSENPDKIIAFWWGLNSKIFWNVSAPSIPPGITISRITRSRGFSFRNLMAFSPLSTVVTWYPSFLNKRDVTSRWVSSSSTISTVSAPPGECWDLSSSAVSLVIGK